MHEVTTVSWHGKPPVFGRAQVGGQKIKVRDYRVPMPKHHALSEAGQQVGLLALDLVKRIPGLEVESMRVSSETGVESEADRVDFVWHEPPLHFAHERPRNPATGDVVKHNRPCVKQPETTIILRALYGLELEIRAYCPRCWKAYAHFITHTKEPPVYADIRQHANALAEACLAWQAAETLWGKSSTSA
jgi:hypothetical protein